MLTRSKAKYALTRGLASCTATLSFAANLGQPLFRAVCLYVMLRGMFSMLGSMNVVSVGQVGMVSGFLVVACFVMRSRFVVVARSVFVVFCGLLVMMSCFL
jgi:hypothetical protein